MATKNPKTKKTLPPFRVVRKKIKDKLVGIDPVTGDDEYTSYLMDTFQYRGPHNKWIDVPIVWKK